MIYYKIAFKSIWIFQLSILFHFNLKIKNNIHF